MKAILLLLGSTLLFQSCTYAISRDLVDRSDRTITFEMLRSDPDQYKGRIVILGGSVVQVTSLAQGSLIEVKQCPLDYWGKPIRTTGSRDHFLVYSPQYIDPATYAPGREITVAGDTSGTILKAPALASQMIYTHPVILSREIKLWPRALAPDQPNWLDPLYDVDQSPVQPQY